MQNTRIGNLIRLYECELDTDSLRDEVLQGLRTPRKELPAKLFYDEHGSQLFDQICDLEEYYLTRAEIAIMREHAGEIAALIGERCLLVEYGSGSSKKTRILLDHLRDPAAYIAIDISKEHLIRSASGLAGSYPGLEVIAVRADYTTACELPSIHRPAATKVAFFPGSTIGNFYPREAVSFMKRIAELVEPGGGLLIGVDVKKDPAILNLAYNDRAGVTAEFNLNMLARINREFHADFRIDRFAHRAFYNAGQGRIEMHLVSRVEQTVRVDGTAFRFEQGESILTEISCKYAVEEFASLAAQAGFTVRQVWMDDRRHFSVQYLTTA